jgi:hypothetical protein
MIITMHGPVLKRSVPFFCCRIPGAAFFGENKGQLMRTAQEWLLTNDPVSEPRPATKPVLKLVANNNRGLSQ